MSIPRFTTSVVIRNWVLPLLKLFSTFSRTAWGILLFKKSIRSCFTSLSSFSSSSFFGCCAAFFASFFPARERFDGPFCQF